MESQKNIFEGISQQHMGKIICAMNTDEHVLLQLMQARATGVPIELPNEEARENLRLVAESPALNLLALSESLTRYQSLLSLAQLDEDERITKEGEFMSLPIDLPTRIKRLDLLHTTFMKNPDNFDDVQKAFELPDGFEITII
ncbi:MAG: hypothetical protein Q7T54_03475 [Candidatus Levybacteria bacterium]|nr:hypothetical protein [Candidatus Levybacteria bacterium]